MTELEDITNKRTTCVEKELFFHPLRSFPSLHPVVIQAMKTDIHIRADLGVYDVVARDKYIFAVSCHLLSVYSTIYIRISMQSLI